MVEYIVKAKLILLFLMGLVLHSPAAFSQITETQARDMLAQRGIPEDTLRARLIKKGIDPDNIAPEQAANFQTIIIETIREIEADQDAQQVSKPTPTLPSSSPIEIPANTKAETEPERVEEVPAPIYGQEIFRNNTIAVYQKAEDIVASDSYILGTGDKIGVIGFGRSQFDNILEIGSDGFVKPDDRSPKILLRGVRFGDAKELLFQRYSQYHIISRGEFQVTLNKPRNMTVNVFGEAKTTGSFTLPGVNTAYNVIAAAGGPTDIGSIRQIKIIRGNETIPLDVYEFMADPGVAKNYFLQNNDYIHIPVAQKVVEIKGAITRPMAYELLDKENLIKLVQYAGGAKAMAYLSDVQITRFLNDRKIITNVNLKELMLGGGDYILYNGDVVELKSIGESEQNYVTIDGAVLFPGQYERKEGMKISDLLQQSILKPDARLDFASLLRYQKDGTYKYERLNLEMIMDNPGSTMNVALSDQDEVQIMTLKTYVDQGLFSIVGAVKNPDTFAINPESRLRLEDALLLAGGILIDASEYGYIMRLDPSEPKTVDYIHFNIRQAMEDPSSASNIEIESGDRIYILDKAGRRDDLTVSVYGAVRTPGNFSFGPGMTLSDLMSLAGGFRFEADNERIDIARSEFTSGQKPKLSQFIVKLPRDFEMLTEDESLPLQAYDHVYIRTLPEYELQQTVRIDGEVKYPGSYPLIQDKENIADLIQRAGGLTGKAFPEGAKLFRLGDSTGLVVIDLELILQNDNDPSNITLRGGDVINIPKSRDLVTIGGYVNLDEAYSEGFLKGQNSISVAYRGEKNAKYYVDRFAAGVSEQGAVNDIRVQFADGRVEKTKKFIVFNIYPKVTRGATVTVGPKPIKPPALEKSEKKTDWGSVLRDTMAQATAVLTLLILVDQLSK